MSDFLMDDQNPDQRYAMDDKLFVRFYIRAIQNESKSAEEGRPIFEDVPCIQIYVPGDKTTVIDVPVTEQHKQRFASRWERFEKNMMQNVEGTPLEEWPVLKTSQVQEFRAQNIQTVEQIAGMADNAAQKFMGGYELKRKAATFLKVSKDTAEAQRLATENAELQDRFKRLEEQNQKLSAQVEILISQKADAIAPSAPPVKGRANERASTGAGGV